MFILIVIPVVTRHLIAHEGGIELYETVEYYVIPA